MNRNRSIPAEGSGAPAAVDSRRVSSGDGIRRAQEAHYSVRWRTDAGLVDWGVTVYRGRYGVVAQAWSWRG